MRLNTVLSTTSLLLLLVTAVRAQLPGENLPLIDHMRCVNSQWHGQPYNATLATLQAFASDTDRIRQHLLLVENALRERTEALSLSPEQKRKRTVLLDELHNYALVSRFPRNTHHGVRTPYFIDDFGTACAVGQLIIASGHEDLALRIRDRHNYNYLRDIPEPEVLAWAEHHGFGFSELEWIQPAYQPEPTLIRVGGGTNGPVNCLRYDVSTMSTWLGGSFTEANGSACPALAAAQDTLLSCSDITVTGTVTDIGIAGDITYLAGHFETGTPGYGFMSNAGGTWQEEVLSTTYAFTGTAVNAITNEVYFAECDMGNGDDCHLWRKYQDDDWEVVAATNGPVNSIERTAWGLVFAGGFTEVSVPSTGGDSTIQAAMMIGLEYGPGNWFTFPSGIDNEVFVTKAMGNALYVGGRCVMDDDVSPSFCLSRFENGSFQQVVGVDDFFNSDRHTAIHDIDAHDGRVFFAGNFSLESSLTFGSALGVYYPLTGFLSLPASVNGTVYDIEAVDQGLYVGGDFTEQAGGVSVHNIAFLPGETFDIPTPPAVPGVVFFPNPVHDELNVNSPTALQSLEVLDVSGRPVLERGLPAVHTASISLENLPAGPYLIRSVDQQGNVAWHQVQKF